MMPLLALIAGFFSWQIAEYFIHRYVGHSLDSRLRARHMAHHDSPTEYGFEWRWTLLGLALVALGFAVMAALGLFVYGLLLGYWHYEWIHRGIHEMVIPKGALPVHHRVHHMRPAYNYGVSSRFMDRLLGTAL